MPTYTIKDSDKDEIFDTICTYDELQEFLENNPNVKRLLLHQILYEVEALSLMVDLMKLWQRLQTHTLTHLLQKDMVIRVLTKTLR